MGWPLKSNYKYKCHCSGVTESTGTDARLLICSAGSQMSDVHHRHHTFITTYLNSPCGRLPGPTGVPRKFIPLPREPHNLQSRSRLYRGIFPKFQSRSCGKSRGTPAGHSCSRSRAKLYSTLADDPRRVVLGALIRRTVHYVKTQTHANTNMSHKRSDLAQLLIGTNIHNKKLSHRRGTTRATQYKLTSYQMLHE